MLRYDYLARPRHSWFLSSLHLRGCGWAPRRRKMSQSKIEARRDSLTTALK